MEEKVLVVCGATGKQGSSVLRHLCLAKREESFKLRATTRNLNSASAKRIVDSYGNDVELVAVDFNDLGSLERAFEG